MSPTPVGPKLPPELATALRELQNSDLVVCPAEKGASAVVLPATCYRNLCLDHLAKTVYETVTDIPPVNCLLRKAADPIWDSFPLWVQRRLEAPGTRFPNFYGLPKTHKTPVAIQCIVSSVDSDTYWWAVWLHLVFWPSVEQAPSTLRDSTHLVTALKALQWPEDGCFLTLGVVQLYTSIKHEDGLRALAWHVRDLFCPAVKSSNMEVMRLCLVHNYFSFAGQVLQLHALLRER